MIVLDASALLAFLQGEEGSDRVEEVLADGVVGAANWSEVAQKVRARGGDWELAGSLLRSYGLKVESVIADDAELAAALWKKGAGLSPADRLCLALGARLGSTILTADRAWGSSESIEQLRTH